MAIEIIEPGLAASIQDQGRPGYYNVGIPPSGALDLFSAAAANVLVGNPSDAAVIESTYMGPKLRFTEDTVAAVTGADIPVKINGHTAPMWESFPVKTGDELSFGILEQGARMYVAVAGSFAVPEVLGSRSLYALCRGTPGSSVCAPSSNRAQDQWEGGEPCLKSGGSVCHWVSLIFSSTHP